MNQQVSFDYQECFKDIYYFYTLMEIQVELKELYLILQKSFCVS